MVTNLSIQAEVIDIGSDTPLRGDIFLVDTNVWFWQTYLKTAPSEPWLRKKVQSYTKYLKQIRANGATPAYCGLIFAEISHIIEREERQVYSKRYGINLKDPKTARKFPKEYRHSYPLERARVVAQVEAVWQEIERIGTAIELVVNDDTTNAARHRFHSQALDGYDLFLLEAISRTTVDQIRVLTDDMDYATVPNIQVFTSSPFVLQQAQAQEKLLVR
ncbi:MAG: hypothetical protein LH660_10195 [Phormidesmis sp. CAN_BIN36]|nr:hypothetical protein [Phormidesmis sp. CAN_BIN36]